MSSEALERAQRVLHAGTGITHEDCRQTGNALARDVLAHEAALAVAREREQRAMKAMVEAAIPLEVLAGQIRTKPYRELTDELQAEIERAVLIVRAALVDEPAADGERGAPCR